MCLVGKGSELGKRFLYSWLAGYVFLPRCLAAASSHPPQPKHIHTPQICMDHTLICLYIHICMYTCIHWHVCTFVYLCVLISINAPGCVFMCAFLFWEKVWNISAQIRECCRDHCCVFQNHDYFLSCLCRKSKPTPPLCLGELCVCRCIYVYACAPVCMACMHICVGSQ